jgi:hypothetical protein
MVVLLPICQLTSNATVALQRLLGFASSAATAYTTAVLCRAQR